MICLDIIDPIVLDGLDSHGHKDITCLWQPLGLRIKLWAYLLYALASVSRQCTHFNSQAIICSTDLEITDCALGYGSPRRQFVIDVKTVAMVDSNGQVGERWNARMGQYDNPGLSAVTVLWNKRNIGNMNLHTLTQAIVLWRLYVLHLVLWVPLLFAIWMHWLRWDCASMRLFVVYKI